MSARALVGVVALFVGILSIGFLAAGLTQHHLWKDLALMLGFAAGSPALIITVALAANIIISSVRQRHA